MTDLSRHHLPRVPDPNEVAEHFGVDPSHERAGERKDLDEPSEIDDHDKEPGFSRPGEKGSKARTNHEPE